MAIVQCEKHHFYDDKRYASCPICAKGSAEQDDFAFPAFTPPAGFDANNSVTQGYADIELPRAQNDAVTQGYSDFVSEDTHTIGIFTDESENRLTVGWLVCMGGPVKGKSYPFFAGRCFAGRSPDMDIVLSDDLRITRVKHFSLVYDPKSIAYYLVPGYGQTYLNGAPVSEAKALREGDRISAGDSEYCFVPFCKEGRVWA
jgi:hypothetical protein